MLSPDNAINCCNITHQLILCGISVNECECVITSRLYTTSPVVGLVTDVVTAGV